MDKKSRRENLRAKGQFWTPSWVAGAMVAYVDKDAKVIFDPGVGRGAFYQALKRQKSKTKFYGIDVDRSIISEAISESLLEKKDIEIRDFILNPPVSKFKAIVANPPYIRHHRLNAEQKNEFKKISLGTIGSYLDGRAGLHIYFLLQALKLLDEGGRLAFIMPADTCEGVFAKKLWEWITKEFRLEVVITFHQKATPFPGVDTNAVVFLIEKNKPTEKIKWVRVLAESNSLLRYIKADMKPKKDDDLHVYGRSLDEALATGLSRPPRKKNSTDYTLADFASVMRGIATGANDFFFLTAEQVKELGIPDSFFISAIGRTRDAEGGLLNKDVLAGLEKKGRPTRLFYPNGHSWDDMPMAVKKYIIEGERRGLPKKALISTRRPWYKMETRKNPPFFFAYLGRRNARFIKNDAGAVPLTGFLCIYPNSEDKEYVNNLWKVLQHPDTIRNLHWVGKSYGGGAIKVEPRSLEKLPISAELVRAAGLKGIISKQLSLV